MRLISGKMNIRYIKVKPGVARGAKPMKLKDRPTAKIVQFNAPSLVITLKKAI